MARGDIDRLNKRRTREEREEAARKAARASVAARQKYSKVKDIALKIGDETVPRTKVTKMQAAVDRLYSLAVHGSVPAFLALLKARGEDVQHVEIDRDIPIQIVDDGLDG